MDNSNLFKNTRIVFLSVIIALCIGFYIGTKVSNSVKNNAIDAPTTNLK